MKKEDALKIILESAKKYNDNLEGKNFLFVYRKDQKIYESIETYFFPGNFHHLTGTTINRQKIESATDFYEACLQNRLTLDSFEIKKDGTTELKLQVLPRLMRLQSCTNMIGDFHENGVKLQTEKLAGNIHGCMGFVKKDGYYIPNTVLCCDIRNTLSKPYGKVDLIFSKSMTQCKYKELCYSSKSLNGTIPKLPKQIEEVIDEDILKTESVL